MRKRVRTGGPQLGAAFKGAFRQIKQLLEALQGGSVGYTRRRRAEDEAVAKRAPTGHSALSRTCEVKAK